MAERQHARLRSRLSELTCVGGVVKRRYRASPLSDIQLNVVERITCFPRFERRPRSYKHAFPVADGVGLYIRFVQMAAEDEVAPLL